MSSRFGKSNILQKKGVLGGANNRLFFNYNEVQNKPLACKDDFDPVSTTSNIRQNKKGRILTIEKRYKFKTSDPQIILDYGLHLDQEDLTDEDLLEINDHFIEKISKADPARYKEVLPRSWKP